MKTEFYKRLKQLCEAKGTSITKVTSEFGWSTSLGTNWKNGMIPHGSKLQALAEYFGVPTGYLLGEEDPIVLPKNTKYKKIPVFGRVAAGVPLEAIGDIVDEEELSPDYDPSFEYCGLVIHGDSMSPKFVEGDTAIVRLQSTAENGDTVIVFVNGTDATCKKILQLDDGMILRSENPKYGDMRFTAEEIKTLPVTIWGKVVELRRKI